MPHPGAGEDNEQTIVQEGDGRGPENGSRELEDGEMDIKKGGKFAHRRAIFYFFEFCCIQFPHLLAPWPLRSLLLHILAHFAAALVHPAPPCAFLSGSRKPPPLPPHTTCPRVTSPDRGFSLPNGRPHGRLSAGPARRGRRRRRAHDRARRGARRAWAGRGVAAFGFLSPPPPECVKSLAT